MADSVGFYAYKRETRQWYKVQKNEDTGHFRMIFINTPPTQEEPPNESKPTAFILYDEVNGWSEFLTAEELETVPVFLNGERIATNL